MVSPRAHAGQAPSCATRRHAHDARGWAGRDRRQGAMMARASGKAALIAGVTG